MQSRLDFKSQENPRASAISLFPDPRTFCRDKGKWGTGAI